MTFALLIAFLLIILWIPRGTKRFNIIMANRKHFIHLKKYLNFRFQA